MSEGREFILMCVGKFLQIIFISGLKVHVKHLKSAVVLSYHMMRGISDQRPLSQNCITHILISFFVKDIVLIVVLKGDVFYEKSY